MSALYSEMMDEYMASYDEQTTKIKQSDKRIEELASQDRYQEKVKKLSCFLGIIKAGNRHLRHLLIEVVGGIRKGGINRRNCGRDSVEIQQR